MAFQTEIQFTLPKGYMTAEGMLHREGRMRLATAADEILPLKDPRVQQNPAYLTVILLSRVVTKLGSLADVHPGVIEGLFASDLSYLQAVYQQLNGDGALSASAVCPHCEHRFDVRFDDLGEASKAIP
jgi:hypothetical protein